MNTPMELPSSRINDTEALSSDIPYRSAIGSLMYLMICTRPDLGFAVETLSQHCETPLEYHWTAVKRVYRYIKGTKHMGITYGLNSSSNITAYCDSDVAGCGESRKLIEGC